MNKHMKLFIGFLAIILIALIIGTVSFTVNIYRNSEDETDTATSDTNEASYQIFLDDNNLYGIQDDAETVLLSGTYTNLQFISDSYLLAYTGAVTDDDEQTAIFGIIDVNGNIMAPFVYDEIEVVFSSYYVLTFADSAQYGIYDSDFQPYISVLWDSCTWDDSSMTMKADRDEFTYTYDEDTTELILSDVSVSRFVNTMIFSAEATDASVALLSADSWIYATDIMQDLMEMMVSSTSEIDVSTITDGTHEGQIESTVLQENQSIQRFNDTASIAVDTTDEDVSTLTWTVSVSVYVQDEGQQTETLTVTMEESEDSLWIVTDIQQDA